MMTDEARDVADERHARAIARAISACTPEGCHDRLCPSCNPIADARLDELKENIERLSAAEKVAGERLEAAYQALDDYEVSLGLPSILR